MARICAVCGKKPQMSFNVSHSHNRTKRWLFPNVHTMRFTLVDSSSKKVKRGNVCTKCIKAGKVKKVV